MNKEQLNQLLEFIDKRINEKIEVAFGRDSWPEVDAVEESKEELLKSFGLDE